jgi:hypothetical protein
MTQQELNLRTKLQSELIIYTVKLNQFNDDFDLVLKEPLEFKYAYYIPYCSERGPSNPKIVGVDGTTGELLCENIYQEWINVRYQHLSTEELTRLHHSVLQGEYVLQILI